MLRSLGKIHRSTYSASRYCDTLGRRSTCARYRPFYQRKGKSMPKLSETIVDASKKKAVIDDCEHLLDEEVASKGGISGLAVKAGFKVVKGVKPGFVRHVITELLPEFAVALDPFHADALAKGKSVSGHFSENAGKVADALLAVTDSKARNAKSGAVKGTYEKLRGSAKSNVEAAVPRLGKLVEKHTA